MQSVEDVPGTVVTGRLSRNLSPVSSTPARYAESPGRLCVTPLIFHANLR